MIPHPARNGQNPAPARFLRASAWIVTIAVTLLLACKDHPGTTAPEPVGAVIADSLIFTLNGVTVVSMGETPLACCGLYDPGFVNERAMRIVLYDPGHQKPGWQVLVLIDRAQAGAATTLPTSPVSPSKVPAVSMFVADLGNELSSDADVSTGTITVHSFSCDATSMSIHFSVDATLGSEFVGGATMDVHGAFRATFPAMSCP